MDKHFVFREMMQKRTKQFALRIIKKFKNINRKERKEFTPRTQYLEFELLSLCALCEKPLRLCGKNTFNTIN